MADSVKELSKIIRLAYITEENTVKVVGVYMRINYGGLRKHDLIYSFKLKNGDLVLTTSSDLIMFSRNNVGVHKLIWSNQPSGSSDQMLLDEFDQIMVDQKRSDLQKVRIPLGKHPSSH
jgi:hypothetical protein